MPNRQQFNSNDEYNLWYREYRKRNSEKMRLYNREYNKEWRHMHGYKTEEAYKLRYPQKEKARRILRYAVRIGLIKKKNCEICNSVKSQAHHEDYNEPLQVVWLCALHHKERHVSKDLCTGQF